MKSEDLVLYKDGLMLVLNKPPGIAVHRGRGKGPHMEEIFMQLAYGLPKPPALAHRLDKDTSGCLVLGRHPKALRRLGDLFASACVKKTYWAIVDGRFPAESGEIALPLAPQSDKKYQWRMKVDEEGKEAKTLYRILQSNQEKSWVELRPLTGRTHQLRVHCAALGCPVLGDKIYGKRELGHATKMPLMLHAVSIEIPLYPHKAPIVVQAPAPEHFVRLLKQIGLE